MRKEDNKNKEIIQLKEQISDLDALVSKYMQSEEMLKHALRKEFDKREEHIKSNTADLTVANSTLKQEIEVRQIVEEELRYRVEFEKIIALISNNFIRLTPEQIDSAITDALKTIGEFVDVDRSYLFLCSDEGTKVGDVYEWCAQGIKPQIENLKNCVIETKLPWFSKKIRRRGIFCLPDCSKLPVEAEKEKQYFLEHGIQSLIVVPMFCGKSFFGFIGFDSVLSRKNWAVDIIALFRIIGQVFAHALERKSLDTALKESENRYHLLFQCALDGIILLNMDGIILDCNNAFIKLVGFNKKEIIGKHISAFLHDEYKELFKQKFYLIKNEGKAEAEYELNHKNGETISVWFKASAIYDEKGNFIGALKHCRDITERKRNEDILLRAHNKIKKKMQDHDNNLKTYKIRLDQEISEREKAQYQTRLAYSELDQIFNTAADAMGVIDKDFNVIQINDTLTKLFAIGKDESLKRKCYELFPSYLCHTANCPLIRISNGETRIERAIEIKCGEFKNVPCILTATPFWGNDGEFIGIIEDFKDITEYRKTLDELKNQVLKNEKFLEISSDGFFVIDKEGNFIDANPVFSDIIGYSKSEILRMKIDDIETAHMDIKLMRDKIIKQGPLRINTFYRNQEDKLIHVEVSTSLLEFGENIYFFSSVHDITQFELDEKQKSIFFSLLNNYKEGVAIVDLNNNFLYVNTLYAKLHDFQKQEEFIGKHISQCHTEKQLECLSFNNEPGSDDTKEFTVQTHYPRSSNSPMLSEISRGILRDPKGRTIGKVISISNIQGERGLDTSLEIKAGVERVLINSVDDSALIIDKNGEIVAINERAAKEFSESPKKLTGSCYYDLLPRDIARVRKEGIDKVFRSGRSTDFIEITKENLIKEKGVSINCFPLKDKNGHKDKVLIISKMGPYLRVKDRYNFIDSKDKEDWILIDKKVAVHKKAGNAGLFDNLNMLPQISNQTIDRYGFQGILSQSEKIKQLFTILPSIAESSSTVLIQGESGTGKHLFAQAIHNLSPRRQKPFIVINCGALPDTLLESELFGYKAGAFTDAKKDKEGRFALANGGTLFLDEIGDISPAMQVRLLRFLQEKVFEPLGSIKSVKVDVRVITATNKNLLNLVKEGRFRQDLFYRINVVKLEMPPLRERLEDVPILVAHFINQLNEQQDKKVKGIDEDALLCFLSYEYPGNIRELQNIVERAFVLSISGKIEKKNLPEALWNPLPIFNESKESSYKTFSKVEAAFLLNMLKQNNWNKIKTARQLGIHKATLFRKIKSLGLKEHLYK